MESNSIQYRENDKGVSIQSPSSPRIVRPSLIAPSVNAGNQSIPSSSVGHSKSRPPVASGRGRPNNRERSKSKRPKSRGASKKPEARSWAAVASAANKGYDLDYTAPQIVNNKPVIHMDESDLQAADPKLYDCLVGYFIGRKLPFKVVEEALRRACGPMLLEVLSNGRGVYLLRITDKEFRRRILEGGPITVARIPFILQQWQPGVELKKDIHMTVPVWVRLKNLPFAYWSVQSIGKVASAIGRPLYVDKRTEQMSMLSFARVCVEITVQQTFCETIDLITDGKTDVVEVEFEWKPVACLKCGVFGHSCKETRAGFSTKASAQDKATAQSNPEAATISAKGKEVALPTPAGKDVDNSHSHQAGVASVRPFAGGNINRTLFVGESSAPQAVPRGPSNPPDTHPCVPVPSEPANDSQLGWNHVKRKNNKKKKKKQAAREAAALARDRQMAVAKTSFGLFPLPLTEEDPPNLKSALAEDESSDEICNSSLHEGSSDDDSQAVGKPVPKGPTAGSRTSKRR